MLGRSREDDPDVMAVAVGCRRPLAPYPIHLDRLSMPGRA